MAAGIRGALALIAALACFALAAAAIVAALIERGNRALAEEGERFAELLGDGESGPITGAGDGRSDNELSIF